MMGGSSEGRIFRTMGLGLKDLKVWQEAVGLGSDVIRALRQTNRREIKAITEHTMVTALLMAEHVAEGYGRYAAGEQRQLYRTAKRDLLRLETAVAIARQAELLSATHHAQLTTRIQTVNRLLSGFLVYLDRQIGVEMADTGPDAARARNLSAGSATGT
jgi:four helix bundle protein